MMTSTAFHRWCDQLALPPATRDLLAGIRGSQPVRRVTSRANNMSGTYPSDKMGVTIQYESHTVELWAILVMERDPDVLEFYDQPHTFKLQYLGKPGKKMVGHYYTPDFLVLRRSSAAFEEWKTENEVLLTQRLCDLEEKKVFAIIASQSGAPQIVSGAVPASEENPPVETRLSVEGSSEPTQDVPPKRPGRGRKKAMELQTQPIELSQPALSATGGASLPAGEVEVGAAPL